jgi:hypothetical protein
VTARKPEPRNAPAAPKAAVANDAIKWRLGGADFKALRQIIPTAPIETPIKARHQFLHEEDQHVERTVAGRVSNSQCTPGLAGPHSDR